MPVALTPEEVVAYDALVAQKSQGINPLRDFSEEDIAGLAVKDKSFNIAESFRSQPDLQKDPQYVQKVANALNRVKQRGFSLEDLPTVPEAFGAAGTAIKGLAKQGWNYANILGNVVGGVVSELTGAEGMARGYSEDIEKRLASNIAGTEEAMTGLAQLGEKGVKKAGRALGISKDFSQFTPEEKVADLFAETGKAETSEQRLKGEGAFTSAVTGGTAAETFKKEGVTPEEVGELAAGDPFSFYLFGKAGGLVGGAAKAITPAVVGRVAGAVERGAATAAQKIGGGTIQAAGKVAEAGAKTAEVTGKVASIVGPLGSAATLLTGADVATAGLGGLATGAAGTALKRLGQVAMPAAKKITQIGREIGGAPITSAYAQVGKDVLQALPGAAGDVAKGTALDIGLAAATAELPQDTQGAVGFGTAIGALGGAARIGGRVISGQLIAPRAYGVDKIFPSSGQFPTLEKSHNQAIRSAPPGVRARLNAIREFVSGAAPDTDVFLSADPASMESALRQSGVSEQSAKAIAQQEGFFTTELPGKDGKSRKVIVLNSVDAAPHESFHVIQDVLGEEANRNIDRIVREAYADRWDQEGQSYAQRLGNRGERTWQDAVLDESGWGLTEAKEKLHRDIFNRVSNETGAAPAPGVVEQMAKTALGRVMDEAVTRNPNIPPEQIAQRVWREILSPAEIAEVADRYIAREIAAENFDAIFKNQGPRLQDGTQVPQVLARILGGFISALGGEPLAGRTSELGAVPLRAPVVEAVREAGRGTRPSIEPAATLPTPQGAPRAPVTPDAAAEEARTLADAAPTAPIAGGTRSPRELLGEIAEAIAQRGGVKINYLSAPGEPAAATTSNRTVRRDIIEAFRTMPPEARSLWEKTFFPDQVTRTKQGNYQIQGWAPEVFAANAHKLAKFLSETPSAETLSPYAVDAQTKSFTADAWQELYRDTQTFVQNQIRGRTGAGEELVVPRSATEAGAYQPPVRPGAEPLAQNKADFINLLFNFKLPETPRVQKGRRPLNVIGQEVSAATKPGRVEVPVRPRGEFTGPEAQRQGIEGVAVAEVNPLRNQLEAAALAAKKAMPSFIEAIQKLNLENIKEVQLAPEVPEFRGNTLTLTAGFQPERVGGSQREWRVSGQLRGSPKQITVKAPDQAGARKAAEQQGLYVQRVETADKTLGGMFSPKTARGRELEKQGFEFSQVGDLNLMYVEVKKDSKSVGSIVAKRESPTAADLNLIRVDPEFQKQGIGEALYRELGKMLQDAGITDLTGMIVNEKALSKREKVFPDTSKDVIEIGSDRSYAVRSKISPRAQFSPKAADVSAMDVAEFNKAVKEFTGPFGNGLTGMAFDVGSKATSSELADLRAGFETAQTKIATARAERDIDTLFAETGRSQFFREAIEAATGEGASESFIQKNYDPKFVAPLKKD